MRESAFDNRKYLEKQGEKIQEAITNEPDKPAFLEFGGKPFTDHHAARVLPGYDKDKPLSYEAGRVR
jgi:uncharacterized protein (UPF0371 family)